MTENIIQYKIERKTSEYNKYIKWRLTKYHQTGQILSMFGFKTKKAAEESLAVDIKTGKNGFMIGDNKVFYKYLPVVERVQS